MKNQAMVMTDVRTFQLQDVPMPTVAPGEVGVQVMDVGICGSDMHFYEGHAFHIFPDSLPFVLGHECAGVVYEVGQGVTHLQVGDKVALEPGVPCGKCEFCEGGRYNLCPDVVFLATPPYEGALKRCISHPAHKAYRMPESMSTLEGALIEPLSVGIHAANRGEVKNGHSVAILGGGCIGLCTLLAAKAWGATRIIVSDLFDNRLQKAKELGATDVVNSQDTDAVQAILELTNGAGVDVVFETAGIPVTAAQTSHIVRRGGTIVLVGNVFDDVPFSFRNLYKKEAQVRSVFRYCNTYPMAIQAVASGRIDVKSIVSARFPFERSKEAFDLSVDDKLNCIKTVITMGNE